MVLPQMGTPEHDAFMRKAKNPGSVEAHILKQLTDDTVNDTAMRVRKMTDIMCEAVPGQLFRDIGRFHAKFGLEPTKDPNHKLPDDLITFRIKFMLEELHEYAYSLGLGIKQCASGGGYDIVPLQGQTEDPDMAKAMDGLIDLVYVALGTAFLHRFPFNEGWDRVQEANMAKERATGAGDARSTRKHIADIVKPKGWKPPVFDDLIGPYAPVHALLRDHEKIRILLVVENGVIAVSVQERFDKERCLVIGIGEALVGRGFDVIVITCNVTKEYIDTYLRGRLLPGGQITSTIEQNFV